MTEHPIGKSWIIIYGDRLRQTQGLLKGRQRLLKHRLGLYKALVEINRFVKLRN